MPQGSPPPTVDAIRAATRRVFAAREYSWLERPDPLSWVRQRFLEFADWLDGLRHTHPAAYVLVLAVMVGILAAIAVHLATIVRRALRETPEGGAGARGVVAVHDAAWHLAEARRLAAAGRYREALAARFAAVILDLDQRGLVRFHASKTPGEYAREARLAEEPRGALRSLVRDLYRYLFGGVPCSGDAWQAFDAAAVTVAGGGGDAAA